MHVLLKSFVFGGATSLFILSGCGENTAFTSAEPTRVSSSDDDATTGGTINDPGINPAGQPGGDVTGSVDNGITGVDPSRILDSDAVIEQNSGEAGP